MSANTNSLWGGPCLLAPMHLDALVVGTPNQSQSWASVAMNYTGMGRGLNPAPVPFTLSSSGAPMTGVHLHWTLPYGIRSGAQNSDGTVQFPLAPNRWLVTRFFTASAGTAPVATAWIVESDYLSTTNSPDRAGTNGSYPNPQDATQFRFLGRRIPLGQWGGSPITNAPFIQARGPGDISWSVIYNNVQNVFGFHDPVGSTPGTLSYAVMGWYADPTVDPLFGPFDPQNPGKRTAFTDQTQWQALMDSLRFAVMSPDEPAGPLEEAEQAFQLWLAANPQASYPTATSAQLQFASQTLCHGMLFNITWSGPNTAYPSASILSSQTPPTVAVGSTAAESVAAYMGPLLAASTGQKAVDVENLLLAFQADRIFDYLSDSAGFDAACLANRFDRSNGGTVWRVILPQDNDASGSGGQQEIPLNDAQTAALTSLQTLQGQLDVATQSYASVRWELFSAWWKYESLTANPPFDQSLAQQIQNYINLLATPSTGVLASRAAALAQLTTQRDDAKNTLTTLLGANYVLKAGDAPQFTSPTDPVVLIASAGADSKLGPSADIGTSLFTRFTGQTLGGLTVDFSGISPSTASLSLLPADLAPALSGVTASSLLPKETVNLWIENLLLDSGNSNWLAKLAFAKANVTPTPAQLASLAQRIAMQQTLAWNAQATYVDQSTLAAMAGLQPLFAGLKVHVPSIIAVCPWTPPWTPLYLDWEVEWCPSASTPQAMFNQWQLQEMEFAFTGTGPQPAAAKLQVRSVLTTNYPTGLSEKIGKFLDMSPNIPMFQSQDLSATLAQLQKMDLMVQSLTGLNQWMQMRVSQPSLTISDANVASLTDGVLTWVSTATAGVAANFCPLRAGHFRITKLQVVDAYGQILPGTILGGSVLPIRSQSLLPNVGNDQSLMQLTPRIAQPARLDLQLLSATDDSIFSNSSDETSPLCGWLLPNHLDESVLVFDGGGNALGEILKVITDSGPSLRWDPAPGTVNVLGGKPQISNPHLLAMVTELLALGVATTEPLDELLGLIDVSLWSMDPLGPVRSGNLSLLLGRPIAVVRAKVRFEIQGDPVLEQSYANTGKGVDLGFPSVGLPLRIGDLSLANNGSFGYFYNDDYSSCRAMYGYNNKLGTVRSTLATRMSAPLVAMQTLAANDAADLVPAPVALNASTTYVAENSLLTLPAGGGKSALLTVLVDPRGAINALSGTLPVTTTALPSGPVDTALRTMEASFRMGPLLLNAAKIQLPLPAATGGKWSWIERTGVTFWNEQGPLIPADPTAQLSDTIPTLREGWLLLGDALGPNAS